MAVTFLPNSNPFCYVQYNQLFNYGPKIGLVHLFPCVHLSKAIPQKLAVEISLCYYLLYMISIRYDLQMMPVFWNFDTIYLNRLTSILQDKKNPYP